MYESPVDTCTPSRRGNSSLPLSPSSLPLRTTAPIGHSERAGPHPLRVRYACAVPTPNGANRTQRAGRAALALRSCVCLHCKHCVRVYVCSASAPDIQGRCMPYTSALYVRSMYAARAHLELGQDGLEGAKLNPEPTPCLNPNPLAAPKPKAAPGTW